VAVLTKIFLSSAASPNLKNLRDETAEKIEEIGHHVLRYEKNFSPWCK
jgi:hypothetical protein